MCVLDPQRAALGIVVALAVLAHSCTTRRPEHAPHRVPGIRPERIGANGKLCPDDHPVAVLNGIAYPAGHPNAPVLEPSPDRCFRSTEEANTAGFPTADPPSGSVIVDDLYLVPTGSDLLADCRRAARAITVAVACPTMLPYQGSLLPSIDGDAALFEGAFPVPPGHDPRSGTHLWVISGPPSDPDLCGCSRILRRDPTTVHDSPAAFIECGPGAEFHGEHIVLVWGEGEGTYAVSLHGTSGTNRRLDRAIAESVRLTG